MAVTTDPSKTGISETDALALTGTKLASNVVNASLNSITPTGGTLEIFGVPAARASGGFYVNEDGVNTKVVRLRSNYAGLGPAIQVESADPLLLLTSNTERARVTTDGNFLIGTTTNDGTKFRVAGGNVAFGNDLTVTGGIVTGSISATGTVTAQDFEIPGDNFIRSSNGGAVASGFLLKGSTGEIIPYFGTAPFGSWTGAGLAVGGYFAGTEQTAPAAPAANGYRIFAQDNGAGKTQLMVIFASGAAQQIAIEP